MTTTGSVLVVGTTSDAGKSVLAVGICRWLARQGVRVAPFKAQNMSNNSVVAPDGAEIGRALATQAAACGVPAEAVMNPVRSSPAATWPPRSFFWGHAITDNVAAEYRGVGPCPDRLLATVLDAYGDLRLRFDVVVCEGAGSPSEINLPRRDLANMGLARARDQPVLVVGDISSGGVFAALYGTLMLLDPADQAVISGFVINKFGGDQSLLTPGLAELTALISRPVLGVVQFLTRIFIDAEDAEATEDHYGPQDSDHSSESFRVAVIRLPHISKLTDVDALAIEPGVSVRFVASSAALADADLVILPGAKATVADLAWLRARPGYRAQETGRGQPPNPGHPLRLPDVRHYRPRQVQSRACYPSRRCSLRPTRCADHLATQV